MAGALKQRYPRIPTGKMLQSEDIVLCWRNHKENKEGGGQVAECVGGKGGVLLP